MKSKAKTKAKTKSQGRAPTVKAKAPAGQDAISMLKADHAKVSAMFEKYEKLNGTAQKAKLAHEICKELIVHTELEEKIFYPACLEAGVEEDMMDEAQVEHDGAKVLIIELLGKPAGDDYYDAKVKVLSEYIKHHVKEEEQPGEGVFAKARKAGLDTAEIGQQMLTMKQDLTKRYDAEALPNPEFRSLQGAGGGDNADAPDAVNDLTDRGERRPWNKAEEAGK
jgi:uncharacterized protein YdcH (DUF465 family)